jgi:hypothetical protein
MGMNTEKTTQAAKNCPKLRERWLSYTHTETHCSGNSICWGDYTFHFFVTKMPGNWGPGYLRLLTVGCKSTLGSASCIKWEGPFWAATIDGPPFADTHLNVNNGKKYRNVALSQTSPNEGSTGAPVVTDLMFKIQDHDGHDAGHIRSVDLNFNRSKKTHTRIMDSVTGTTVVWAGADDMVLFDLNALSCQRQGRRASCSRPAAHRR